VSANEGMTAERWAEVRRLLDGALARAGDARAAWLAEACAGDDALADEVAALARAHDAADASGALDGGLWDGAGDDGSRTGETVGAWRLGERLGAGGMGEVYAAERADGQFEQEAAVKLFHAGRAGGGARRRFLAERQLLARLHHPGIARLLDGGLSEDGTPFLVMERVRGTPITEHAEAHALDVDARLALFLQAADAVAYAHRHLVVHRDLKPAHIVVEPRAAEAGPGPPRVVLLDFGIARLLDADEGLTVDRAPMTPAWAAPEQLAGDDVTTATDVYGLGLVLYALLAGRPPERTRDDAFVPPSRVAPRERRRRGDLDTIVAHALAPEPSRRYESAAALADDLRRYLAHEPVRARPDAAGYRARRFVRRHRVAVAAGALVALAVVGGAGASLWQAREARRAAERAEATLAFLQHTLYTAEPVDGAPEATVRQALDSAAAQVDRTLAGDPLVAAGVHAAIGYTYLNLGHVERAETHHRRAAALYGAAGPRFGLERGVELSNLAQAVDAQGRADEAVALFEEALALQTRHGSDADRAAVLNSFAAALDAAGDRDRAERYYREAIAIWTREDAPELPLALNNLAILYESTRRPREAVPLVESAAHALRRAGDGPRLGPILTTLGTLYDYTGQSARAADTLDAALGVLRATLGPEHPKTTLALASRALVDLRAGRPADGLPTARAAAEIAARTMPDGSPLRLHAEAILAQALCDAGDADAGLPLARAVLAARTDLYGADHFLTATSESIAGGCLAALGRRAEAAPMLDRAWRTLRAARGDADARTADARRRRDAAQARP